MTDITKQSHVIFGDTIQDWRQGSEGYVEWKIPDDHYSDADDEAIFFYGGPFSNFVGGPLHIIAFQPWSGDAKSGGIYSTVEHFYQASKARTVEDHRFIADPANPWESKKRGNECDLRADWEVVKYSYMLTALRVKFDWHEFRKLLLETGHRYIAEDSPTDAVWGIRNGDHLNGLNLLGRALMEIRDEIRMEERMADR